MMKLLIIIWAFLVYTPTYAIPHKALNNAPRFMVVPYTAKGPHLNRHDTRICNVRAQISHQSFIHAKKGTDLKKVKDSVTRFLLSKKAEELGIDVPEGEYLLKLVEVSYEAYKKYPKADPVAWGDHVWSVCASEKSTILVNF